ncbi:MAG: SH3 domain-containing protein [Pseudonocardiaceae bacterium]
MGASTTIACGLSYPAKDNSGWVNFPANTVTLRSGPSNSCIQTGQGVHDQRAQYLCYTPGDGGTWTFLRNTSTGDQGWVRDDQLAGYGSYVRCEDNPPPASVN